MKEKKIGIKGADHLLKFLTGRADSIVDVSEEKFYEERRKITRRTFQNYFFSGNFWGVEFRSAKFKNCEFDGVFGFFCIFQKCEFENCHFRNCRFSHIELDWSFVSFKKCHFRNIELDEGSVFRLTFDTCSLTNFTIGGIYPSENIRFIQCDLEECYFSGLQDYGDSKVKRDEEFIDLLFDECRIDNTNFHSIDFRNSTFLDTIIYKTGFIDCQLDKDCLVLTKELKYESYASMDFQTILKSDELNEVILSKYFNVKNKINLKDIISSFTTPKIFSTVFISYSFKDNIIAKKINQSLNARGIRTFLWEKDASGGKLLEEIMTSGITAHDKLLFIASEYSIRSKACQYELTTARKKQETSWENVFFPITIDDYLFKVKKSQIRPVELSDEYWQNIEEIKRVNALDFSSFNKKRYTQKEFKRNFEKIVEGLKIVT